MANPMASKSDFEGMMDFKAATFEAKRLSYLWFSLFAVSSLDLM